MFKVKKERGVEPGSIVTWSNDLWAKKFEKDSSVWNNSKLDKPTNFQNFIVVRNLGKIIEVIPISAGGYELVSLAPRLKVKRRYSFMIAASSLTKLCNNLKHYRETSNNRSGYGIYHYNNTWASIERAYKVDIRTL